MAISFEFFPPKSDAAATHLYDAVRVLADLQPSFVSVTCGAGGSAIDGTYAVVKKIRDEFCIHVAPHIAFSRQSKIRLDDAVRAYKIIGVEQVVAIRGDATQDSLDLRPDDTYANTIDFIADLSGRHQLKPVVAAYPDVHPLAKSAEQDLEHLRKKIAAGGTHAISQFFFEADTFLRFRDSVQRAGIPVALTPGILPIHNLSQALKFATGCGAKIPTNFASRFECWNDDADALFNEGVTHMTEVCDSLRREGVTDFHFYTLNRSAMVNEICSRLDLGRAHPTPLSTAAN